MGARFEATNSVPAAPGVRVPAEATASGSRDGWRAGMLVLFLALLLIAASGTGYRYRSAAAPPPTSSVELPPDQKGLEKMAARLRQRQRQLLAGVERKKPKGLYIVIDQTQNRLWLMKDDEVLREAKCSAGSGMLLQETATGRKWVFDTPRGTYKVLNKLENPVWKKPDWAFIEEGLPIPEDPNDRFDFGVLGKYALYFGDGYMIHGTLYENLIGRSVTHGCIRLGRDDLKEVYRVAGVGTPIYIY
jgi:L,D-transpeptidase YbiS